ncbi:MAG: hypothetical protein IJL71_05025 [Oscillospiraceae bacterium]|nr:hypothetical protein [Oscillospiraceae bacterium]
MRPFAFLGFFLIAVGIMVIYSAVKGSGKAGMAKVEATLKNIAKSDSGRFLYTEYTFDYCGEEKTVKCGNKTKNPVGTAETMYYDVSKDILSTAASHWLIIAIGAASILIGILVLYFQSSLSGFFH